MKNEAKVHPNEEKRSIGSSWKRAICVSGKLIVTFVMDHAIASYGLLMQSRAVGYAQSHREGRSEAAGGPRPQDLLIMEAKA